MFPQGAQYPTPTPQGPWGQGGYGPWASQPMMWGIGTNPQTAWFFSLLWLVTWILVIVILIAVIRWLWRKGDRGR